MRPVFRLIEMPANTSARTVRAARLFLASSLFCGTAATAGAQAQVVKSAATILSAPNGRAIGSVREGAEVRVLETRGPFARVSVNGFVERARLSGQRGAATPRVGSRDAIVRSRGVGSARSVASLESGTTVTIGKGAAPTGWVSVSRTGWVRRSLLAAPARVAAKDPPARTLASSRPRVEAKSSAGDVEPVTARSAAAPMRAPAPAAAILAGSSSTAPEPSSSGAQAPVALTAVTAIGAASAPLADSALVPTSSVPLRAAPDARALATIAPGTALIPLARERGWVRVRVEGWVPERDLVPADTSIRAGVSAADLRADPQGSKGKVVRWTVQVLARQTADALRRDLGTNETYLLARGPDEENALLYLVVPPALLEPTKSIGTLTTVVITARVRTGKSELVGVPILDLQTITPRK